MAATRTYVQRGAVLAALAGVAAVIAVYATQPSASPSPFFTLDPQALSCVKPTGRR